MDSKKIAVRETMRKAFFRLRRHAPFAALAFVALAWAGCSTPPEASPPPAAPVLEIALVPEMAPVPQAAWPFCPPESFPGDVKSALAEWAMIRGELAPKVTPEAVRVLSRWAKPQMAGYGKVPPLESAVFAPVAESPDKKRILLEATLDTLPSHSPLVKRWLKAFLVYDRDASCVVRAVVTIRGQAEE